MIREQYREYCTECRWMGIHPVTLSQWLRDEFEDPREAAQERAAELWENDTWDLY
jgi:hypothetical protein